MNDFEPSYDDLKIELTYMKQYVDQLRYQIVELKRNRFGSTSEKFDNPMQKHLHFNEINDPIDVTGMPELATEIPSHKSKKKSRFNLIARKNFMFSSSQEGARALCLNFSLI